MAKNKVQIKTGANFTSTVLVLIFVACAPTVLSAPTGPSVDTNLSNKNQAISTNTDTKANKHSNNHIVATTLEKIFNADGNTIWNTLVDFKKYPDIFSRVQSVQITKQDGALVYTESCLKPGLFVQKTIQHTVNDLSAGPKVLNWQMLDGNFKYLKGEWQITSRSAKSCSVKYTLYMDLGSLIPAGLINFVVHHIQQEIISDLKRYVEVEYKEKELAHS